MAAVAGVHVDTAPSMSGRDDGANTTVTTMTATTTTTTTEDVHGAQTGENVNDEDARIYLDRGDGPSALLVGKIRHGLKVKGYNRVTEDKVVGLVKKNVLSVYMKTDINTNNNTNTSTNTGSAVSTNFASATGPVEDEFRRRLDQRRSEFNSNEPVLLVTIDDAFARSQSESDSFKTHVLKVLRDKYGIRPVRVYVVDDKSRLEDTAPSAGQRHDETEPGVGLALLNVVNTEIGGPSMIQLLDHDHVRPEWQASILSSEAWREYDFLWSDGSGWNSRPKPWNDHSTGIASQPAADPVLPDVHAADSDQDTLDSDEQPSSLAPVSDEEDDIAAKAWHPEMAVLQAQQDARGHVAHPTWEHSGGGGSLADLVRSQAQGLPALDNVDESGPAGQQRSGATDLHNQGDGEDDFVVV